MSRYYPAQRALLLTLALLSCSSSMASVVITGTRQIYLEKQKEITVKLTNDGTQPALVQAWVDAGDVASTLATAKTPFLLTPPLSRVDPGKGQSLRLMFVGAPLPTTKETVFWLNVLEIPPKSQEVDVNSLQMAFRSRIKIFYRPEGLVGNASDAIGLVQWRAVPASNGDGFALEAFNPSAFHVSIAGVSLIAGAERSQIEGSMVAPGEAMQFALPVLKALPVAGAEVEFSAINDYGAQVITRRALSAPAVRPAP
ncbi:molecular chaperone [Janthinobacterium sp. NKUCC06_STL]|uniref:fimbrial biogenesis chaperone n=1 Tax=Janthinobacterium sp. NKUCC06_STL TaxID=2842127 RepID=UPI001C5B2DAA|nr:fimbria/pilus periplasmic chaperone [Janthinobacterium sp. NKUCC06_STL]MBW3512198.1 fimbria/pilus periplasmic chaperone [Janthinobacterium sp. NKUCC06_STL]